MKFFYKVFAASFFIAALMLGLTGTLILRYVTSKTVDEYVKRYQNVSKQVSDTLVQIDKTTDRILTNALFVLREREKNGLPSNEELMKLKKDLGIDTLYITSAQGRYLRSDYYLTAKADPEIQAALQGRQPLTKSLFSYCQDYRNLVGGRSTIEKTPIIPSGNSENKWPYKFLMIPNHDGTRVLEGDMAMNSIGDILKNTMEPDLAIKSIGLFTPEGETLGYVHSADVTAKPIKHLDTHNLPFNEPQRLNSSLAFYSKVPTTMADCCECRVKGLATLDGQYYYVLRTEVSRKLLNTQLADIRVWFVRMGLIALLLSLFVAYFVSKRLVRRLAWMGEKIEKISDTDDLDQNITVPGKDEVALLASRFNGMLQRLKASQTRLAEAEKEKALVGLAKQVAHDIRSPLAALDTVVNEAARLPEGQRIMVRGAVRRIRDIANDLLGRHSDVSKLEGAGAEPLSCVLVSSLIDPIVSEKRLQFRDRIGLNIDFQIGTATYGLFVNVQPVEFKRAISNIINNGVEAIERENGSVLLTLAEQDGEIHVRIEDDGKGIPADRISKLGYEPESHGKAAGTGLGLCHARRSVEAWGGRIEIASEPGKGTAVSMILPRTATPDWFVARLEIHPGRPVVILDDDTSIHQVWQEKLGLLSRSEKLEGLHFSIPNQLRIWVAGNKAKVQEATYLLDYELLGFQETGLSLAREMGIGPQTILVTSRYEESAILEECRRLGVRMIPKGLVGYVPIRLGPSPVEQYDAVLIDNDYLARLNWKRAAAKAGKNLRLFASSAEFFQVAQQIDRETAIYVDHELGEHVGGDQTAVKMSELGFRRIYLTTGHDVPSKPWPKHLKGVIGKEPPWPREVLADA